MPDGAQMAGGAQMADGSQAGAALAAVEHVLAALTDTVTGARSMPLSASCVVNRAEVLGLIDDLRARLPQALDQAHGVLGERAAVVEGGQREAERVVASAREEQGRLVGQTGVARAARTDAERIVDEAVAAAAVVRAEAADHVDATLATLEVVITKTLQAVARGRRELAGESVLDALREVDPDEPPLPG